MGLTCTLRPRVLASSQASQRYWLRAAVPASHETNGAGKSLNDKEPSSVPKSVAICSGRWCAVSASCLRESLGEVSPLNQSVVE